MFNVSMNVARVRLGALPLIEMDFIDEYYLELFCKSMSNGVIQAHLQDVLRRILKQEVDVTVKLYLIMPNAEKKSPVSREVTTDNYKECFSIIRESALFEFQALGIAHDTEQILCIDNLRELLQELTEMAASWFTVGAFLKGIEYYQLEAIEKDNRDQSMQCLREMLATWLKETDASPAALVQALRLAGRVGLAKKMAVKYGVAAITTESKTSEPQKTSSAAQDKALFDQFVTISSQDSRAAAPDLSALREKIAAKDTQYSALSERLIKLKKGKEKVTESLEKSKLKLDSVKHEIEKLKFKQGSLVEKIQRKESSRQWLVEQRASKSGADLVQINQLISDTEEAVTELTNQIDELEERIKAQNERVDVMTAQLAQKEREKKELVSMLAGMHENKAFLERKLEDERIVFESQMERMMFKQKRELNQVSHEGKMQKMKLEQKLEEEKGRYEEMERMMQNAEIAIKNLEQEQHNKQMCNIKLSYDHPVSGERLNRRLEVDPDVLMYDAMKNQIAELLPAYARIENCRLAKYNASIGILKSLDLEECKHKTFGEMVGGVKKHYPFELLLEICREGYDKGEITVKVLVVDQQPVQIRADLDWTVERLKREIGKMCSMDATVVDLIVENDHIKHLSNDSHYLSQAGFYKYRIVYASAYDHQKPFRKGVTTKDGTNSIFLITLPPCPHGTLQSQNEREIRLRVQDNCITVAHLKTMLKNHIGAPSSYALEVYLMFVSKNMERLADIRSLASIPSESQFLVRISSKQDLKTVQTCNCFKLYLLRINKPQFCEYMMECIVSENTTVLEFKHHIVKEAREQGIDYDLDPTMMRLRRWKIEYEFEPGTIFLDNQFMDYGIFNCSKIYVEPLDRPDPMRCSTQTQVYVRWWHPLSHTVDPTKEIVLDKANPVELKVFISELSGIPSNQVLFAKGIGLFPCKLSVLDIETKLDWYHVEPDQLTRVNLYGGIVYFKDSREHLKR